MAERVNPVYAKKYRSAGIYANMARRFTRRLRAYDKSLCAVWLHDVGRWGICSRDRKGWAYLLYRVETPDGGYRDVSQLDIRKIGEMDRARERYTENLCTLIDRHNAQIEERQRAELKQKVHDISKDRWRSVAGVPLVYLNVPWN